MDFSPFLRVLFAAALAVPIGLDRELRGKPAGLRTHVVVAAASGALGVLSIMGAEAIGADQTRIAAQVVTGIGFMGAGIIFASGGKVHGLTTAAALWSAMAVGLSVGLGADALAVALVVVTMLFLWPVDWLLGRALAGRNKEDRSVYLAVRDWAGMAAAHEAIVRSGGHAHDIAIEQAGDHITARVTVSSSETVARQLLSTLRDIDAVAFAAVEAAAEPTHRSGDDEAQ
jgi:putative Mg2+ transporter-C (MgtC) family protein